MPEPITLAEAKAHLRVLSTDEDDLITDAIVAARRWVENYTGLILVQREVTQSFDRFEWWMALNAWPIASDAVVTLSYIDSAGEAVEIADHRLVAAKQPARLMPAYSSSWPTAYCTPGAVTATFTAGYASPSDVPQELKSAIKIRVLIEFERRAPSDEEQRAIESLCGPSRMVLV